ncbi:unnamed protein product, partial [Amoebophrya sp. A120]|eukprot:GSA120T00015346001.1
MGRRLFTDRRQGVATFGVAFLLGRFLICVPESVPANRRARTTMPQARRSGIGYGVHVREVVPKSQAAHIARVPCCHRYKAPSHWGAEAQGALPPGKDATRLMPHRAGGTAAPSPCSLPPPATMHP